MAIKILDGGMGQELLKHSGSTPTGLWSAQFLIDAPNLVKSLHHDYFAAGADIISTNSYILHRDRLRRFGLEERFEELQHLACRLAIEARDTFGSGMVAGIIGPTGGSYQPELAPPVEVAAELFAEIAKLQEPYVDLLICETMSSIEQARGALMGATLINKPVWLSVTVDDYNGNKLRSGEELRSVTPLIEEFKLDALLINCSPPEAIEQSIPHLNDIGIPLGAYANGFREIHKDFTSAEATVDILEKRTNLSPETYADFAAGWIEQGTNIIGGCCEVGPEHIRELARRFK